MIRIARCDQNRCHNIWAGIRVCGSRSPTSSYSRFANSEYNSRILLKPQDVVVAPMVFPASILSPYKVSCNPIIIVSNLTHIGKACHSHGRESDKLARNSAGMIQPGQEATLERRL